MDLALAQAARGDVDLVIANDPDADRCAAAIPTARGADGGWRMLTGDELGALLAWWIVQRRLRDGLPMTGVMASSIVSGSLVQRIAEDAGFDFVATLTGFKWIAKVPGLVFGYEEALGYCVDPQAVADKDGVSAALLLLELAAHERSRGRTLQDVLDDLARRFGVVATGQASVRVEDLAVIQNAMRRLREHPPAAIAGRPVLRFEDLTAGVDGLPPTDGVRLVLADARVIVRPSGTEPKLKCYLQIVEPVGASVASARERAAADLAELGEGMRAVLGLA